MHKCPQCGFEFGPPKQNKPYEYKGTLANYLPLIIDALRSGESVEEVVSLIRMQKNYGRDFHYYQPDLVNQVRYIGRNYGLIPKAEVGTYWSVHIGKARKEHAWLLRAEGMKFKEIGKRLGISMAQARILVFQFGRETASRAMKRTKFSVNEIQP